MEPFIWKEEKGRSKERKEGEKISKIILPLCLSQIQLPKLSKNLPLHPDPSTANPIFMELLMIATTHDHSVIMLFYF